MKSMPRPLWFFRHDHALSRVTRALMFLAAVCLDWGQAAAAEYEVPAGARAFLERHCVACHDADANEGGLDLTSLEFDATDAAAFARWVRVFDRVRAGEMPPKDETRPEAAELATFLEDLGGAMRRADGERIERVGRVQSRRLTRFEYERTLHDLLGIDVPLVNLLPEDPRADGFDTVAAAQGVSHFLLEKYLATADVALDEAFRRAFDEEQPYVNELGWQELRRTRPKGRNPTPRYDHQDVVSWSSNTAFNGRIPQTEVPDSGWYRVTMRVASVNTPAEGRVWCGVRSGVCFASAPLLFWIGSFAATPEVSEHTFDAWIEAEHIIQIQPDDFTQKRLKFGQEFDFKRVESLGAPGVAIKSLRLERIHHGPSADEIRRRLVGDLPIQGKALVSRDKAADAARLVREFAARAFRRPVTAAEVAPYVAFAKAELAAGGSLIDALRGAYRGVLASPRFLYLEETPGKLNDHALAARLSYFLWSSMPDEELRALADRGELSSAATLGAQVERMLDDDKARAFVKNFTGQWLNLTDIDFTLPDTKLYPEYDEILKFAMLEETESFFGAMLADDLSVRNVVDSDFGIMNSRLAKHYGMAWSGGEGTRRVAFKESDHRGGIITQASVLKVTANGTTTSPVVRGAWMLERIMGEHVPPPPANVPAIEPDIRGANTIREQLVKHRHETTCAACHVSIDPPGFALESYDVIGGWRTRYRAVVDGKRAGRGWKDGPSVDPSYQLASGERFADIDQFKALLLADPRPLAANMAAKLTTYATGAGISFSDRDHVEAIVDRAAARDHGLRTLVREVIASPMFTHK